MSGQSITSRPAPRSDLLLIRSLGKREGYGECRQQVISVLDALLPLVQSMPRDSSPEEVYLKIAKDIAAIFVPKTD